MEELSSIDGNGSVEDYYSIVSEPLASFKPAGVRVGNQDTEPPGSESFFLNAYSLSDVHQVTSNPAPETVQLGPALAAATTQFGNMEQPGEMCVSLICLEQRNHLSKRVHELFAENQNILLNNTETRKRLVEKELELGLAQDSNSRLQVNFNSEIVKLRNKNWTLETEVNTLRTELARIYEKINKLYELNFIGDRNRNTCNVSPKSFNHNNNRCATSLSVCTETNCAIQQMNYKLDNVIQLKKAILSGRVDEQFSPETQPTEKSFLDQNHEIESTEELNRNINYKLIDELQANLSPSVYDSACPPSSVNYFSQEMNTPTTHFLRTEMSSPEDDDDDITILTEIRRDSINNPSTASNVTQNQNAQSTASSTSFHAMDYDRSGFTCTCGGIFFSSSKLDEHLRQCSSDGQLHCTECDATFYSTQKLQMHMEEAHEVLVLDQCKACGKVFKTRTDLLRHEKSSHAYGSHSTDSNQMDFIDELIDQTGIIQQMNSTAKETTKSIRLTANPQSSMGCAAVGNETPVHTLGGKVPLSLSQPQNDPSHSRHGLDAARSLPGDYFWCLCGSRYLKKQGLHLHITSQSQPTNFICGICGRTFSRFRGMKKHMEIHHGFSK